MKTNAVSVWCGLVMAGICMSVAIAEMKVASGQEPKSTTQGQDESEEGTNKQRLTDMRKLADTVQVTAGEGEESKEVKLIPKPLFRFSDRKRFISDGTIWAWGVAGRPVLMAEFHTGDRLQPLWGQWLVATSDVPLAAVIVGRGRWATGETDFKLLPVEDLGAPADSEAGRLRQMKRFARTLSASSEWKGQQFELRLLETEVYRYSDIANGLVDGAVFVFAVDSNPEAILLVEAHQGDSEEQSWKYSLAQMTAASLTFRRGDSDVWSVPRSFGGPRAPHYAFERTVPGGVGGSD